MQTSRTCSEWERGEGVLQILVSMRPLLLFLVCRVNYRQRNYAEVSTQLHGAVSVVEEFSKYHSIPQIKQLMDRYQSHDSHVIDM